MITNLKLLPKLKSNKDEECFFNKSFVLVIIGKPGSGKTSIIQEILLNEELLKDKFDYIFIFSPSPLEFIECEENCNWFKDFTLEKIFSIIEVINENDPDYKKVLFIFDDLVGKMHKEATNENLLKLFFNRRHLIKNGDLSYIIVSQRYIAMPTNIRACISNMIFFKLTERDYKVLKTDLIGYLDFGKLSKVLTNDYDFLCLSLENGLIFKNFSEKIII